MWWRLWVLLARSSRLRVWSRPARMPAAPEPSETRGQLIRRRARRARAAAPAVHRQAAQPQALPARPEPAAPQPRVATRRPRINAIRATPALRLARPAPA